jgi:hypothetical protein
LIDHKVHNGLRHGISQILLRRICVTLIPGSSKSWGAKTRLPEFCFLKGFSAHDIWRKVHRVLEFQSLTSSMYRNASTLYLHKISEISFNPEARPPTKKNKNRQMGGLLHIVLLLRIKTGPGTHEFNVAVIYV